MNILCYLFGHTGNLTESGYHVCSRCGLHEYWHSRQVDPTSPVDYDLAGVVVIPMYKAWGRMSAWLARYTRKPMDDSDLPF